MTALKKQVLPRLVIPLTGTKVLLMTGLFPLDGSEYSDASSRSLMILGETARNHTDTSTHIQYISILVETMKACGFQLPP